MSTLAVTMSLIAGASTPDTAALKPRGQTGMDLEQIKGTLLGDWVSIAPEIRPSASKNAEGTPKPFHLRREFK